MKRYFDTSALIPYYRPEPSSGECERLLLASHDGVVISLLTEIEVASVLARLVRMGELEPLDAARIGSALTGDLAQRSIVSLPVEPQHFARARDWLLLRTTSLRTLDALHLACASALGAELVTRDATLAHAAASLGVPCIQVA